MLISYALNNAAFSINYLASNKKTDFRARKIELVKRILRNKITFN